MFHAHKWPLCNCTFHRTFIVNKNLQHNKHSVQIHLETVFSLYLYLTPSICEAFLLATFIALICVFPNSLDEGLQLAVALSTSLQEEQERQAREECITSETTDVVVSIEKPTIPDAFKVLMSPKKSNPTKRDKRRPMK